VKAVPEIRLVACLSPAGPHPTRNIATGHERTDLLHQRPQIASEAKTFADRPELGQGEVAERPIAVPKVRSTNEIADLANLGTVT
jgi:hypothetical protein